MMAFAGYLLLIGEQLDELLNVLLLAWTTPAARRHQTISEHAAEAQRQRRAWGCLLCRWLSLTVQRDHCGRTLRGEAVTRVAALLAGLQLLAVAVVLLLTAQHMPPFTWHLAVAIWRLAGA